jgi:methylmalonyl-CoA/ethylmalonyl-CoA epimerase
MKFDHIGIVVESIKRSRAIFERDLPGFSSSKIYIDKEIDVKIQFIEYHNSNKIELIEPLSASSPIRSVLEKKNSSNIHHLAYSCRDIEETCNIYRDKGYGFLTKFYCAEAFEGARVIFLLSPLNFIVELIEDND